MAKCNGPVTPLVGGGGGGGDDTPTLLRPLPDEPPATPMMGNHVGSSGQNNLMKLKKYEFGYDLEYEDR